MIRTGKQHQGSFSSLIADEALSIPFYPLPEGSPCTGCAYAKGGPCIGYCMKKLMKDRPKKPVLSHE